MDGLNKCTAAWRVIANSSPKQWGAWMVLIVDPDPISAPSLVRLLRYNGYPAEAVATASEGLALLSTRRPAAIILDLALPLITGLQLIKAIRMDPDFTDVPLIVYTGEFSNEAAIEALAAGAADVIVKGTVGTQSLLARIEKHLNKKEDA
jgi:two-component system response regulator MprA